MGAVDLFVNGELSLEEAFAGEGEDKIQVFLEVGNAQIVMGVGERGPAPVFTCVPVGLGAGFSAAAGRVFRALDGRPPSEQASGRWHLATRPPALPPEIRPGLVSALANLVREGGTYADR